MMERRTFRTKKILGRATLAVLALLVCPQQAAAAAAQQLALTLQAREYSIENGPFGARIRVDGFHGLTMPGMPPLPVRRYSFLLPPGARTTGMEIIGTVETPLDGEWDLEPAVTPLPLLPPDRLSAELEDLRRLWQGARERMEREGEERPRQVAWLSAAGTLGKFSYATLTYCPFAWNPSTGELVFRGSADVAIEYRLPTPGSPEEERLTELMARQTRPSGAERLFWNWSEASAAYRRPLPSGDAGDVHDYVIITTGDLVDAVDASDFVPWKTDLGYSVKTVMISDAEIADQPGDDLAEQIRNFLREYYVTWGIEYVLLVGDYETVPMRICYPNPDYHVYDPSDPGLVAPGTPTDCYYADLSLPDSVSWDADGDGYLGEYGDDSPDFAPEVYVGRLPVGSTSRVTYALNKTVLFEQDDGAWKTNVLHPTSILFFENQYHGGGPFVDGATAIDSIEQGLMGGCSIDHMSEQYGIVKSAFPWPAISETDVSNLWRNGRYGVVNWSGHGWTHGAARTVWSWDDGDGVPESGELESIMFMDAGTTELEDDYPSVVFAISCDVGFPEPAPLGNCGIDLLTEPGWGAAVGVMSAARPAAVSSDWKNDPGGAEQICYDFNRHLIAEGEPVGTAAYLGMYDATSVYGWDYYYEYMNMYNYNLYGDPSLELQGFPTGTEHGQPEGPQVLPALSRGRPNPFGAQVAVRLMMPGAGGVQVDVYDAAGRRVRQLVREGMAAGEHVLEWDGTDGSGEDLAPGVYFLSASVDDYRMTEKLVLLRQ